MRIKHKKKTYVISNKSAFVESILVLVNAASSTDTVNGGTHIPARNDVKALWRHLRAPHKRFLNLVASYPAGLSQGDVLKKLALTWVDLRGVHNGLARICDREGVDKPISTMGYNAENRVYHMQPDIANTILKLAAKD